ncbi:uncharacterized protein LOC134729824 [Pan paniscus]|uniref:uncharacterized protein LOC134729824 n=1 Tax=Pan paniscus TaxID=9597 RepID=UPI000512489A
MAPKSKNFLNFIASFLQRFLGFACEAVSPRPRASERASQRGRQGGRKGWGGGETDRASDTRTATDSDRSGARDLGDGEVAGREKPVYAPCCNPTTCPGQVSPSPLLVFHNAGSYFDFMHCPSAAML